MKTFYAVSYEVDGTRHVVWFADEDEASRFHDKTPNSSIHGKYQAYSDEAIREVEEAISKHKTWRWSE